MERGRLSPLLVSFLVCALVVAATGLGQKFLWQYAKRDVAKQRFADLDREAFLVGARIRGRANDMYFLKRVAEGELTRNPGPLAASENLRSAITGLMLSRSMYGNIRLIDLKGRETLRYNWEEKTQTLRLVPQNELQDKSTRPFYLTTLKAGPSTAVFSPLDLNVENGQVQTPYQPVLRVSGQIAGPDGKIQSLLVLNYLGSQVFRELTTDVTRYPWKNYALNRDGYWLVGPDLKADWGFMFPERKTQTIAEENPVLWQRISRKKSGSVEVGGKLYCFLKLDPVGSPNDYPPLRMQISGSEDLQWTLLSEIPNDAIWRTVSDIRAGLWMGCLAVVLTLGPLTWFGLTSIFRRRQAMADMRELTRQAQAAERAKSEFLAIMSHEIRTPMNGVIGMTSILEDTELTDVQRDYLNTIQTSGEVLLTVINDILDFSKIESGKMHLERTEFDLRQCVEEAIDLFALRIREKKLEMTYFIAPEVPSNLLGDPNHLRQIFTNLIGNAVKFTAQGEITLRAECEKRDDQGYHLRFSVADTGIGISPDGLATLFQPFHQVDTSTTRRYGGTGLGLVISQRMSELMGGRMWVESREGVGSTFFFTSVFPAAALQGGVDGQDGRVPIASGSALIADDSNTNRTILEAQLRAWGMNSVSAASAEEALKEFERGQFDVVLLDLLMPGMNGVELAREIRRKSNVPMILLSSSGTRETGDDAKLFQSQIPKPVKQSVLQEALRRITGNGSRPEEKPAVKRFDSSLASRHPLRILLAEDNAINQKVVLRMLEKLGYRADLAANGIEVLAAFQQAAYDLVFMDVQMPEMGGIETSRRLRESLGGACPFIVALTAEALEGDRERFLGLGFDGYLSKPLRPEDLFQMLQSVPVRA